MKLRVQEVHKFNVRLANYGEEKQVRVGEMVEDKAVELATQMMTETFIYSVCPPSCTHHRFKCSSVRLAYPGKLPGFL